VHISRLIGLAEKVASRPSGWQRTPEGIAAGRQRGADLTAHYKKQRIPKLSRLDGASRAADSVELIKGKQNADVSKRIFGQLDTAQEYATHKPTKRIKGGMRLFDNAISARTPGTFSGEAAKRASGSLGSKAMALLRKAKIVGKFTGR